MTTEVRALLGRKLAEITPGDLKKTFFTLGGAEANENAIKIARFYTGRHKILARYRSYHGATYGAMALTGDYRRLAGGARHARRCAHPGSVLLSVSLWLDAGDLPPGVHHVTWKRSSSTRDRTRSRRSFSRE